jgi:hypothetical protein
MTSSSCSCHHAARTRPRLPPDPSNEAYLSYPQLEASPATTFRTCSSPTPTPVKPQPTPAILSQESVHTTLSITHHTRMRPSTGPRTTHGPHLFAPKGLNHNLNARGSVVFCVARRGLIYISVDSVCSYQTSYGFASGQIPRRSQVSLLPLSVRTHGIESVEQCATQGFNLVKQGKLSFEKPKCI